MVATPTLPNVCTSLITSLVVTTPCPAGLVTLTVIGAEGLLTVMGGVVMVMGGVLTVIGPAGGGATGGGGVTGQAGPLLKQALPQLSTPWDVWPQAGNGALQDVATQAPGAQAGPTL